MAVAAPVATSVDHRTPCRHCGDECGATSTIVSARGSFCCRGCESVFSILSSFGLDRFYALDDAPGVSQKATATLDAGRFASLDDPDVAARLITFDDGRLARVTLSIPTIHCASCVWLLEQFWRFEPGVGARRSGPAAAQRCTSSSESARDHACAAIAETIASLGYEPAITVEDGGSRSRRRSRRLYLQLGVAGFAFGNIMLFSIPRYANGGPLEGGFQRSSTSLNVALCAPGAALQRLRLLPRRLARRCGRGVMALEVPVAFGLAVLFGRSLVDIAAGRGEGFMDSFAGLVFFLLDRPALPAEDLRPHGLRSHVPLVPAAVGAGRARRRTGVGPDRTAARRRLHPLAARARSCRPTRSLLDEAGDRRLRLHHRRGDAGRCRAGETVRAGGRVVGRALRLRCRARRDAQPAREPLDQSSLQHSRRRIG